MTKFVAFAAAVLLCVLAAGFGAYLALRPQSAAVSAPAPGEASAPADPAQAGVRAQVPPAITTENAAAGAAKAIRPTSVADARPSSRPSRSPSSATAPAGGGAGAAEPTPPALENAAVYTPPPVTEPAAPPQPPGPPPKMFEELVVSADSVLGLRVESTVSSEVARVEDPVEARVTRDVRVGNEVAIPSGTRVLGSVVQVERGGKMKTKARLAIRFHTLVMADETRVTMSTEAVYREGKSPGQESAAKLGAATIGGAILGAIVGGGKGAAIGGSVGAAGGTAVVLAGDRNPAVLNAGTAVTVRLNQPVTVTVERNDYRN